MDSYTCACTDGYDGVYCMDDIDECERDSHLCMNDATCVVSPTDLRVRHHFE